MYFTEAIIATSISTMCYIVFRFLLAKFIVKESYNPFLINNLSAIGGFAVLVFLINYYWVDSAPSGVDKKNVIQSVASGQSFVAPEVASLQKPLNVSCDLEEIHGDPIITEIKTKHAEYVFSSYGAQLQSMNLLWQQDLIHVPVVTQQYPSCIIALDQVTPTMYNLVRFEEVENPQTYILEYESKGSFGVVSKTFVVYKNTYQIDVKFSLKQGKAQTVRLFVASPSMSDEIKAIVNKPASSKNVVQDIVLSKQQVFKEFWFEPKLFGFITKFLTIFYFDASANSVARVYLKKTNDSLYQAILESKVVQPGQEITWSLYMGPKTTSSLVSVDPSLDSLMQYGWLTIIAKPVLRLMIYLHQQTGSYGIAIILLALLIKLLLLPFTIKGERSMKQQAEFEKKRAYLQQKFKHDKAALDQATAELINKHGFPMLSGCLPMLLNIPIFLALNKVLSSAIELHGASFMWLPDLSAADPYYILSVLVFIGMVASPAATVDPRQWLSRIGFGLFLAGITAYLASGLALFIMINTLLGIVQSYIVRTIKLSN